MCGNELMCFHRIVFVKAFDGIEPTLYISDPTSEIVQAMKEVIKSTS